MQLCFFVEFNSRLFVEKGPQHVPELAQELCSLASLQGVSWMLFSSSEHLDFPSPSVRHCKASWASGVVMEREKSRMDVDVNPAGRSRQLQGLLLSYFITVLLKRSLQEFKLLNGL